VIFLDNSVRFGYITGIPWERNTVLMKTRRYMLWLAATLMGLGSNGGALAAAATPPAPAWHYTLLASRFTDDCYCGRPSIMLDLRGGFDLRLIEENPIFATYAVEHLEFEAGWPDAGSPYYQITGQGTYQVGGEVALVQTLFLEVRIDDGHTNRECFFANDVPAVNRLWPMIQVHADQTNGSVMQFFRLDSRRHRSGTSGSPRRTA